MSTTDAMAKSSTPLNAADAGMMARGKYTLLIRREFAMRLLPASGTAYWKYVQGTRAA